MLTLRPAGLNDLAFLRLAPDSPSEGVLAHQIRDGRLQMIDDGGRTIGFIKSYVIWERLPFMEVLWIEETKRKRGHGKRAVRLWEEDLVRHGFDVATISTQAGATAQHFWRKIGYSDCGLLLTKGRPAEIFLQRCLSTSG